MEFEPRFRLEPEWVVVILASLIYSGDVTLSLPGKKIDASNIDELGKVSIEELTKFKPVSYTHLDVYKRQIQTWSRKYGILP